MYAQTSLQVTSEVATAPDVKGTNEWQSANCNQLKLVCMNPPGSIVALKAKVSATGYSADVAMASVKGARGANREVAFAGSCTVSREGAVLPGHVSSACPHAPTA